MPTVGWIRENDIERFLSGTSTTPGPRPAAPPRFFCPFCTSSFPTRSTLGSHLGEAHRASRPYLAFGGSEPSSGDVVRNKVPHRSVHLFNVTDVSLSNDGGGSFRPIKPGKVARIISDTRSGRLSLRLENRFEAKAVPVVQTYDLRFRIYSEAQLNAVDRAFVAKLARPDPTIFMVDEFMEQAAREGAADYSSALGDYVLGVLVKDADPASGVRPGLRDHRRKLNASLRALKDVDRPLARLVSALIRFSSNDFSNTYRTGLVALDYANECLLPLTRFADAGVSLAAERDSPKEAGRVRVTPIDNGCDSVIRWADRLSGLARWSRAVEDGLRAETDAPSCDPLDRSKLCGLWALAALRLGKADAAREPLRLLSGNDCFGEWAEGLLEEMAHE